MLGSGFEKQRSKTLSVACYVERRYEASLVLEILGIKNYVILCVNIGVLWNSNL